MKLLTTYLTPAAFFCPALVLRWLKLPLLLFPPPVLILEALFCLAFIGFARLRLSFGTFWFCTCLGFNLEV